jgi:hypothetical protein
MRRWLLAVVVIAAQLGCSTRSVVVKPEEISKLNDPQWTIKAAPAPRPR